MVDVGELIGGIMSGITRVRRDADMTAAMIAEEYNPNSLLSHGRATCASGGHRGRPPVISNTAQGATTRKSGGSAITSGACCRCSPHVCRKAGLRRTVDALPDLCRP